MDHGMTARGISSSATMTGATASGRPARATAGPVGCMAPDATTDLPSATTSEATDSATTLAEADSGTDSPAPTATAAGDDSWPAEAHKRPQKRAAPPAGNKIDIKGSWREGHGARR
jgi:hypothetical protein